MKASYSNSASAPRTANPNYFGVSLPLLKENLKRYMAIPVIAFLIYLFLGVIPIFLEYNKYNSNNSGQNYFLYYFVFDALQNSYFVFIAMLISLPVITGAVVLRYLHVPASVTALHSMPFTRAKLFNTNIISGLIMIITPVLLTGAVLLATAPYMAVIRPETVIDIFTQAAVWRWMWQSLIIIIAIYAVTVFTGVLTGNPIVHIGASILITLIVPALMLIIETYSQIFLLGYDSGNSFYLASLFWSSPVVAAFYGIFEEALPIYAQVLFIPYSAVLLGFSMFIYYRRRLEKASDSFAFNSVSALATYLIAFMGMNLTVFLILMGWLDAADTPVGLIIGVYVISAVVFFLTGRIIAQKTFRVFNKQTLVSFGIYALIAVAFILIFALDLTGFEKRVPSENSVDSATITLVIPVFGELGFNSVYGSPPNVTLYTKDNINAVRTFHKEAVESRQESGDLNRNGSIWWAELPISYKLNSRYMCRSYYTAYPLLEASAGLKQIFESEEYKSQFSLASVDLTGLTAIYVTNGPMAATITDKGEMDALLNCVDLDFNEQTYEDALNINSYYAYLKLKYIEETAETDPYNRYRNSRDLRIIIPKSYKRTVAWFKDSGYAGEVEISPDIIEKLTIFKRIKGASYFDYTDSQPVTITDKKQIADILATASNWEGKTDKVIYVIAAKFETKFAEEHSTSGTGYYHSEETAPAFLREMFD